MMGLGMGVGTGDGDIIQQIAQKAQQILGSQPVYLKHGANLRSKPKGNNGREMFEQL